MKYSKNGKFGKLKGFDYYLRYETKLRPNQRKDFLVRSEEYISKINEISATKYSHMDESLTDIELMEMWNEIWWTWGWVIDEFKDKWFRERMYSEK